MEAHIIDIVRFATCVLTLVIAVIVMIKADDNNIMRRLSAALAAIIIYFNEQIGSVVYLLIGSMIETLVAISSVGFVIAFAAVIMLLPVIAAVRWLIH